MFLKISGWVFVILGILFGLSIIIHKVFICKLKDNMVVSKYVEGIVWFVAAYIFSAVMLVIAFHDIKNELLALLFAVSPFIIGNFASYKKETTFSIIQILTSFLSAFYVLYMFLLK